VASDGQDVASDGQDVARGGQDVASDGQAWRPALAGLQTFPDFDALFSLATISDSRAASSTD